MLIKKGGILLLGVLYAALYGITIILPSLTLCFLILLVLLNWYFCYFFLWCSWSDIIDTLVASDVAIKVVGNDAYVRWLGHIWFNMVLLNWHYWSFFFSWCSWIDIIDPFFSWCSWIDIIDPFVMVLLNWHIDPFFSGALDLT